MNKGLSITNFEVIELTNYQSKIWCLGCDKQLKSIQTSANVSPRWTCENEQCIRYGLEALLAIAQKSGSTLILDGKGNWIER